jgi:hypothetical protein
MSWVNNSIVPQSFSAHRPMINMFHKNLLSNFQKQCGTEETDWQMIYYTDAVHAFTISAGLEWSKELHIMKKPIN